MVGFGLAVGLADVARTPMLVVALLMLVIGGAADMASAAFRTSMLQSAADDAVRGRLQGVFIVVVAGGPRIADVVHGASAAAVGTAAAAAGGGVLVVIGTVVAALLAPAFVRYRISAVQRCRNGLRPSCPHSDVTSPRTYAAWPACWRSSLTTLTSRTPSVTGGSHRSSTTRSRSSGASVAT